MGEALQQHGLPEKRKQGFQPSWKLYDYLRVHYADRRLAPAAFDELIECEMMFEVQDNPPIGEVFDPVIELHRLGGPSGEKGPLGLTEIPRLPNEKRGVMLEVFKDKLGRQRQAYTQCRLLVERCIEYNPDVPRKTLAKIADFFGAQYGFPASASAAINELIDDYGHRHQKTHRIRQQMRNDDSLVYELTGVSVFGRPVSVREGPISIDILTDRATGEEMLRKNGGDPTQMKTGGFMTERNGVFYTVTINDGKSGRVALNVGRIALHETEHAKNKMFRRKFDQDFSSLLTHASNLFVRIPTETDPAVRVALRTEELRAVRDDALANARDELLAMAKGGQSYFDRFYAKDGNPYDYLQSFRTHYYADPDYAEIAHEILVGEYERVIADGVSALKGLCAGRSANEVVALLTDMPLNRWPNVARRMIEHQDAQNV